VILIAQASVIGCRITDGVHSIGPTRRGLTKGGYSRCYLFEYEDGLVLVDTGWDSHAGMILKYLTRIGRSPQDITHIALTHAHRSHLGGLKRLADMSRARVCSHCTEAPIIDGTVRAHPIRLWPPLPLSLVFFRIISHLPILNHTPRAVDRADLVNGSCVGPLEVLHLPGHTSGHLAFRYRGSVIAVGDAVATWPRFAAGWPGFNRDEKRYRVSLVQLVDLEPEVVAPGHGTPIVKDTAARLRTLIAGRGFAAARSTAGRRS
jgi:glyoxylase-like metal-dependent hydrolase (beta-lactamase superfamily II)